MRRYISYLITVMMAVFVTGCIDIAINPVEPQSSTKVTLQLTNSDLVATRAYTDDNQNNEDLIKSVQCFFAATGSDQVIYATPELIPVNKNHTKTIELEIPSEYFSTLLKDGECDVYVLANYGTVLTRTSINDIKNLAISLDETAVQKSFIMDGSAEVSLDGASVKGSVDLIRVAAKIVVKVNVKKSLEEGNQTWQPDMSAITMTYKKSVKGSKISAPVAASNDNAARRDYSQTSSVFEINEDESNETTYVAYQTVPFYSYPDAEKVNGREIDMVIPWKVGDQSYDYKYQIPVDMAIERNHVYMLNVNVGVLGNAGGAILEPSYVVLDWKDNPIVTTLDKPQYLVVDQEFVVMNNINSYSVGYQSSETISVKILSSTIGSSYKTNTSYDAVFDDASVSFDKNAVTLVHTLDNTRTGVTGDPADRYDYKAQTIVVRVSHANNPEIYKDITFVQYPAMFLTTIEGNASTNNHVMINANSSQSNGNWWHVYGQPTASPDVLTITVSSFDESTANYVICDPREPANTDNFQFYQSDSNNAQTRETGKDAAGDNTLTGYRATLTGNISENLVAPSFMIASSCGSNRNGDQSLNAGTSAKYRCAGYQENGYPAGRWRIPTPAELQVIGRLCAEKKIDAIFVAGASYMSSNGAYTFNNGSFTKSSSSTSGTMRCVYDTWYWKDKCADDTKFIWGADGDLAEMDKSSLLISVDSF